METHFCFNKFFLENPVIYKWKNTVEPDRPRGMRIACWTTKGTKTHSEYLITIAFPLQQWLHEGYSM